MDETVTKTVLVVDDEADIREVLAIALADMGHHAVTAENAARAFDRFLQARPDIVITDIKMPGGDGISLLRKIKHENPETEVIMITGHGDMNLAIRSLKYEATDFITKPIDVDALDIAIGRAIEKITLRCRLRDYTRSLEQLVKEKSELQDHLAALGLMIGSISHGMKGLITNLEGGLYLVSSGLDKGNLERARQGYAAAREAAGRIRRMVLDILFSAKKRDLKPVPVPVADFADELIALVRPRTGETGIELNCRVDAGAGVMTVDVQNLQAAMINILDNAVDACLAVPDGRQGRIDFDVQGTGDTVVFSVADNGVGMDAATRERLFTLFYSTKARKGTGLGLFITQRVVHQHGGSVVAAGMPGKGARFTVTIPRTPSARTDEDHRSAAVRGFEKSRRSSRAADPYETVC